MMMPFARNPAFADLSFSDLVAVQSVLQTAETGNTLFDAVVAEIADRLMELNRRAVEQNKLKQQINNAIGADIPPPPPPMESR